LCTFARTMINFVYNENTVIGQLLTSKKCHHDRHRVFVTKKILVPWDIQGVPQDLSQSLQMDMDESIGQLEPHYPGLQVSPPVHENQLSKSNKLDAEAIWLYFEVRI
jgi:hypothetical protein